MLEPKLTPDHKVEIWAAPALAAPLRYVCSIDYTDNPSRFSDACTLARLLLDNVQQYRRVSVCVAAHGGRTFHALEGADTLRKLHELVVQPLETRWQGLGKASKIANPGIFAAMQYAKVAAGEIESGKPIAATLARLHDELTERCGDCNLAEPVAALACIRRALE